MTSDHKQSEPRLKTLYNKEIKVALKKELGLENINQARSVLNLKASKESFGKISNPLKTIPL